PLTSALISSFPPSRRRPSLFFFNAPPPPELYTLSLHDALPICPPPPPPPPPPCSTAACLGVAASVGTGSGPAFPNFVNILRVTGDRKSTRLNSSHLGISYAVFCLKKKKKIKKRK